MAISLWKKLSESVSGIGGKIDDPDLETQKAVIVVLSLSAIPLGLIWTIIEFSLGDLKNSIVTGGIALLVFINLLFYIFYRNYSWYRFSQLVIFLCFPVVLHFTIGGYTKSANLIWGLATPLIALLSSRLREGTPWFIAFLVIVIVSGLVDPLFFPNSGLSVDTVFFEFSLNIINVSIIVYGMLIYFLHQKNQAYTLLRAEKETSERLLLNVLPKEIASELKSGRMTIADRFESASILFADIVDFTVLSAQMAPEKMVVLLNKIFSHFDSLVEKYGLEKIRTIGDNYMVASGVPLPRKDHACVIAKLALEMTEYIKTLPVEGGAKIKIRVGINSGPVIAGVIGHHKFHYDLWGDSVNTASRMESHGVPGKIQITAETRNLIRDEFSFERRGVVEIKGKGAMKTWFLVGSNGG